MLYPNSRFFYSAPTGLKPRSATRDPLGGRRFSQRLYILLGLELALAGISTMLWAWAFGSFWHI